jgi:hypothetical protein
MTTLCPVCLESVQDIIDCDKHGTCPSCLKTMFMKKYECSIEDAMENGYVVNCPLCRKEVSATVISVYQTGHHSEDARAAAPPPTPAVYRVNPDLVDLPPPRRINIYVQNRAPFPFDIWWVPDLEIHTRRNALRIQSNIAPGTIRKVNVGRRGDRFILLGLGTYLAELRTSDGSSDNYVFTGHDIVELNTRHHEDV